MLRGTKNFKKGYNRPVDGRKIGRAKKKVVKKFSGKKNLGGGDGRPPSYATVYTQSQDFSKSVQIDPFLDVICMV